KQPHASKLSCRGQRIAQAGLWKSESIDCRRLWMEVFLVATYIPNVEGHELARRDSGGYYALSNQPLSLIRKQRFKENALAPHDPRDGQLGAYNRFVSNELINCSVGGELNNRRITAETLS